MSVPTVSPSVASMQNDVHVRKKSESLTSLREMNR